MPAAVLLSGGLDSAVLLADEATRDIVQPIYVSVGLAWEGAERDMVRRFLAALASSGAGSNIRPLVTLTVDMRDVYAATHWAVSGAPPSYHTPDEDVYLPGRNVILLGKAGVYAAAARLNRIVLGTLAHNPFPDATPQFREAIGRALSLGLAYDLRIEAPYAGTSKADVIRRGAALGVPFEFTLSCMNPRAKLQGVQGVQKVQKVPGVQEVRDVRMNEPIEPFEPLEPLEPRFLHCGLCSKCRERHDAFIELGMVDPTTYADDRYMRG
jgi:7-cyano-7-deazaguanine synthase